MRYLIIGLITIHVLPHRGMAQKAFKIPTDVCGINRENSKEAMLEVRQTILSLKKQNCLQFKQRDIDSVKQNALLHPNAPTSVRFAWPLRAKNAEEYPYLGSKNYVDVQSGDCILDYNGGWHTYDGHNGMDIITAPYYWQRKKNNEVYAIASAPGIIVGKRDGGFDGNCSWDNPPWVGAGASGNYFAILHADGTTVSYYKHLKIGSLVDKDSGDYVSTGDYLGVIASSGRSTAPHLHFEVHVAWGDDDNPDGLLIEPFAGPDNPSTDVSLWSNQKPYIEPDVIGIESHSGTPEFYTSGCDSSIDLSTLQNSFSAGSTVTFRVFIRDWLDGSSIQAVTVKPDGTAETTWLPVQNGDDYVYSCNNSKLEDWRFMYHTWSKFIPANAPHGTWAFRFTFNGKIYSHYFTVGCILNQNFVGTQSGALGFITGNTITSTVTISGASTNNIRYKADNQVVLSPGFTATVGCTFLANTQGCVNGN